MKTVIFILKPMKRWNNICFFQSIKSGQKSRSSDVEIISDNKDDSLSFDKKSEDLRSHDKGSEVIPHRLLEEVQLETESDDSRAQFKDKFSERYTQILLYKFIMQDVLNKYDDIWFRMLLMLKFN